MVLHLVCMQGDESCCRHKRQLFSLISNYGYKNSRTGGDESAGPAEYLLSLFF